MSARVKSPRQMRRRGWGSPGAPLLRSIGGLLKLSPSERARLLATLSEKECDELFFDWSLWAREDQRPPSGDWIYWLILAGRGAGKTRAGAEAVREWVKSFAIVNLIGATHDDVRDVMVLGESGIMAICPRGERPRYARAADRLAWPSGAVSLLFSAEEPDRLRGKQHEKLWLDELAAWKRPAEAFDQALLGLRLGAKPQAVITTTPRPTKIIKQLVADPNAIVSRGSTFDNRHHLAQAFLERITQRYAGRTLGRQELLAEIVEETPGALWTRALIERQRLAPGVAATYVEIVVGVDPPARSGEKADECGIVVAGRAEGGAIHVLADLSSQGDSPGRWATRVVSAYRRFAANRVVVEINNGGEMVEAVLRQSDPNLPVRNVTATRGKYLRAEPVAAAYERGIVFHVGGFEKLEDQLCTLTPDFDSRAAGFSPDRADALVWAAADLLGLEGASGMMAFWAGGGE